MANDSVRQFKGLNTVSDPLRLGLGWLSRADNVDITDTGALHTRPGFTKELSLALRDGYATADTHRLYVVTNGDVRRVHTDMSTTPCAALASAAKMSWAEQDERVYFSNGTDSGIILEDDAVLPWRWSEPGAPTLQTRPGRLDAGTYQVRCTFVLDDGRETGASDAESVMLTGDQALVISDIPQTANANTAIYIAPADSTVFQFAGFAEGTMVWNDPPTALGSDLTTAQLNPLPEGSVIQMWKGRAFVAQYLAATNQTAVWMSLPLQPHLFDLDSSFFMVAGEVLALAPTPEALIVGTDAALYAYTGESLSTLAPYGVVPGTPWTKDPESGELLLWTTRGVCSATPFKNLTSGYLSVAPGLQAAACLMQRAGGKKFVASLVQGGTAFNPRQ